jgi:16S rRNA (uracil1498-N3)-methyltransferase
MIRISGKDYHYLARVRRFKTGTLFSALLPDGEEVRVLVRSTDHDCLLGECLPLTGTEIPPELFVPHSLPPLFLFQALPKTAKMDLIVRQAAEGGITEIVPFVSAYSIPKIKVGPGDEKMERWDRIIKEARQQSGSQIATTIKSPCTLEALIRYWKTLTSDYPRAVGVLFHQEPIEEGSFHDCLSESPALVAFLVGPEGGFSPEEAAQFLAAGFKPLVLGTTVLRTETAALYAAAAIRIILLERESWTLKMPKRPKNLSQEND